jgi:hypothetical protein
LRHSKRRHPAIRCFASSAGSLEGPCDLLND